MIRTWCFIAVLVGIIFVSCSQRVPAPAGLRCEFRENPLGIDEKQPALSWKLRDSRRGACQTAYRLEVASSVEMLESGKADLWNSNWIESGQSHLVLYGGKTLLPGQRAFWRVRYCDQEGQESPWSEPAWWEMGLPEAANWKGEWITAPELKAETGEEAGSWVRLAAIPRGAEKPGMDPDIARRANREIEKYAMEKYSAVTPAIRLRKDFTIPGRIRKARLYIATLGFHELRINGRAVDDSRLEPSVGHYTERAYYVVKDVTQNLQNGTNSIALTLSKGRYNETPTNTSSSLWNQYYGLQPATRVYLVAELSNGETIEITSDGNWKSSVSPIIMDSFWVGEVQDARREQPGWDLPGFDDSAWVPVEIWNEGLPKDLVALPCPPEREIRRVRPVSLNNPAPGVWVYDMGELVLGNAELNVEAPEGTKLSLRYAEDVRGTYPDYYYGEVQNSNTVNVRAPWYPEPGIGEKPGMIAPKLRGVLLLASTVVDGQGILGTCGVPTDLFIAGGKGKEIFQRRFGYRPFRYVELMGYPGVPDFETVTGVVLHTGLEPAGSFTCSDPILQKVEEASNRTLHYCMHGFIHDNNGSEKGFFPHIASLNYITLAYRNDLAAISHKMLEDVRVFTQNESLASICFGHRHMGPKINPGGTISEMQHYTELPWQHYLFYGDRRELEKHYPYIRQYLEYWYPNPGSGDSLIFDLWGDHVAYTSEYDIPEFWVEKKDKFAKVKPYAVYPMPREFYGTAMGHKFSGTAAAIAEILGREEDAKDYRQLQERIRRTLDKHFYDKETGTYCREALSVQGANALALYCGVSGEEKAPVLLDHIKKDMEERWKGHLSTGSRASYPLLAEFSRYGRVDEACQIMTSDQYPSLGHMLSFGTGTIGECWAYPEAPPIVSHCQAEGFTQMTNWCYEWLCGLRPDPEQPGFRHFFVEPKIPGSLTSASMEYESNYGRIEIAWEKTGKDLVLRVTVPPNSGATVSIPSSNPDKTMEGKTSLTRARGVSNIERTSNGLTFRLASGQYAFTIPADWL